MRPKEVLIFFENSFTKNTKKKEELKIIKEQLVREGFDAILITKIVGREKHLSVKDAYKRFASKSRSFIDYYYNNQFNNVVTLPERLQLISTETSLYSLTSNQERELLWRGEIEVQDVSKVRSNVTSYTRLVIKKLKEQNVVIF
ncbi:hypothetical protein ACFO5T_05595 [Dokdonia genika]|uniref:Uncharacterized protein n=1 Tax=Dokdonia genika TaxID=308113 RepID=A0ABV9L8R0_9FLAO